MPVFFRRCFTPDTACCTVVPLGTNWSLRDLQEDSAPGYLWGLPHRHSAMLESLLDLSPTLVCSASFLMPPALYFTPLTQPHSSFPSREPQPAPGTCSACRIHRDEFPQLERFTSAVVKAEIHTGTCVNAEFLCLCGTSLCWASQHSVSASGPEAHPQLPYPPPQR